MTPAILIYANCHGQALARLGQYISCLHNRVTFKVIPYHVTEPWHWDRDFDAAFMSDVQVVWEQVQAGEPTENRQRLYERMPADCEIIRFPPMSALCFWPFAGFDPRQANDPHRYPTSDSIAMALVDEDLPDDALFDEYMRRTTERMPALDRRLQLDVRRWRATDDLSDIKLTDYILGNLTKVRIFYSPARITAEPLRFLMEQLLQATRLLQREALAQAMMEVDLLLRFHGGLDYKSVPIHPLVGERMGLEFFRPDQRYRWHDNEWTFREYIINYIKWAPYLGLRMVEA